MTHQRAEQAALLRVAENFADLLYSELQLRDGVIVKTLRNRITVWRDLGILSYTVEASLGGGVFNFSRAIGGAGAAGQGAQTPSLPDKKEGDGDGIHEIAAPNHGPGGANFGQTSNPFVVGAAPGTAN